MFLRSYNSLRAIRMAGIELIVQCVIGLFKIIGQSHIVLLIHSLKLCMETTDYHILERSASMRAQFSTSFEGMSST